MDFLRSLVMLIGGVGVLKRWNVGRLLVIAAAVLSIVMFLAGTVASFALGALDANNPGSIVGGVFGIGCSGFLNLGFAFLALLALLPARNAAEFRA